MSTTLTKLLAAALLVLAPAGVGVATMNDSVSVPLIGGDEASQEAETVETFEKTFETNLTTGELDLRIDRGEVRVEAWEKNAYEVRVLQTPTDDDATEVTFEDASEGSHLNLSVVVDRNEQPSVHAPGVDEGASNVERAIVAYVPAHVAYERVYTCEGEAGPASEPVHDALDQAPVVGEDIESGATCVPGDTEADAGFSVYLMDSGNASKLNVTGGVIGLHGSTLTMLFDNGDAHVDGIDFETVTAETDNGDIEGASVVAERFDAETDNGDVDLEGDLGVVEAQTDNGDVGLAGTMDRVTADTDNGEVTVTGTVSEVQATSDNGDITLQLTPESSGQLDLTSDNGRVAVTVPETSQHGYDVTARTDNGDITIDLEEAEAAGAGEDDEEDEHGGDEVHARTSGYEDRAIKLEMSIATDNGDVWVTAADAQVDGDSDGSEDDSGTGAGSTTSTLLDGTTPTAAR